jgi:peptidoglycan-associated lipoprotein
MLRRNLILFAATAALAACGPDRRTGPDTTGTGDRSRPNPGVSWREFTDPSRNGYSDRVFFDYDAHELRPDARETVDAWSRWLKAHPGATILIEGHADERGTREYNLALGARRANAVRDFLGTLGVEPGRIRTVSYGKERPAEAGSNEQAWARNRRGEAKPSGPGS